MTITALILALATLYYRRAAIRHATRANALRATVDALAQERWERTISAARKAKRDQRLAAWIRGRRGGSERMHRPEQIETEQNWSFQ